jgi:hypothetical protein
MGRSRQVWVLELVESDLDAGSVEDRIREASTIARVLPEARGAGVYYEGPTDLTGELCVRMPVDRDVGLEFAET